MFLKDKIIKEKLSEELYKKYLYYRNNYLTFDDELLKEYSIILKEFAFTNKCQEYALIFSPLDNKLAYKHLTFYKNINNKAIKDLDIKDLINSEIDASSLENGELRDITHAKGLISIDTNSIPFIYDNILYIPAVYKTINGESLDNKTPLLNSIRELNKITKKVYKHLGSNYEYITPYLGIEQEFYLLDKQVYLKRKDLKYTNHTLLSNLITYNNNYLTSFNNKEEKLIKEIIKELENIDIIPKSQHKEVGQSQFEIAPLYTKQNISIDNNQILKKIIQDISDKYEYIANFDDKPFKHLSGSGKHNNYSLITDIGENLLEPTSPHYLLTISAFILGIDKYNELLRLSSSSYSNENRLGQKEAPSTLISISLGEELTSFLKNPVTFNNKEILLDRNRTSPIAFLGNKFEFRMIGSSIDPSLFNTCLNTLLIESFKEIDYLLMNNISEEEIIKDIYNKHNRIINNENNYTKEFQKEMQKRGINNLTKYHESLLYLLRYKDIFIKNNIMNYNEIKARINIYQNKYLKDFLKDYQILNLIIKQDILPSLNNELIEISKINKVYLNEYNLDKIEFLKQISNKFNEYSNKIQIFINKIEDTKDLNQQIELLLNNTLLIEIDECYKKIENNISQSNLSLPTYLDLLN